MAQEVQRKPEWLKKELPDGRAMKDMRSMLRSLDLHTICESALCPNIGECWGEKTATLMIMGEICTRRCGFCDVTTGRPVTLDPEEPENVAKAVESMGIEHAVITTVTRDDIEDGGAAHFAETIRAVHRRCKNTTVEALISDFDGREDLLSIVLEARPEVLAHNLETVERLHRKVRPRFRYKRSLDVLAMSRRLAPDIWTKSNIMVGLGETEEEVIQMMRDLRAVDCDFLTIGQYLRPSDNHLPVREFVHPDTFKKYQDIAEELGFKYVFSGPFVRSSYQAGSALQAVGVRRPVDQEVV